MYEQDGGVQVGHVDDAVASKDVDPGVEPFAGDAIAEVDTLRPGGIQQPRWDRFAYLARHPAEELHSGTSFVDLWRRHRS